MVSPRKRARRQKTTTASDRTHAKLAYLAVETVLLNVGRPDDLIKAEGRYVGENAVRVNLVRESTKAVSRRDSFYLVLTDDGFVAYSNPPLERRFNPDWS